MIDYILFIPGLLLLIKGAELLVSGSVSIARRLKVPDLVIGLTIVSMGTSLPELIVNLIASFSGNSEIAIGNIFGSNIANTLLILGVSAIVYPLSIRSSTLLIEIPISLIATLLVGFLANAALFDHSSDLMISRPDGIILLFFFAIFMLYIYNLSRTDPPGMEEKGSGVQSTRKSILFIFTGIAGLFFGGKWVISGAVKIAVILGLSQSFIGLSIVAIGTSLPELVTSVVAARKKSVDIAVGNVIGSNIFNILWILGLSAVIKPLPFLIVSNLDILVMIGASLLVILSVAIGGKKRISRLSGSVFLISYIAYITFLVFRG